MAASWCSCTGAHRTRGATLRQRPAAPGAAWTARYEFGAAAPAGRQGPAPRYTLWPVRPSMWAAARAAVIDQLKAEPAPAQPGDPPAPGFGRLSMWIVPVVVRHDAARQALVVESEWPQAPLQAQSAVEQIGELLDGKLADRSLRDHLAPRPPALR